ncbi:hypothetical protein QR680_002480 [Steinernema hermaphroditum]|uniref:Sema domain-containing protein n=1 Tax=Steinernema hermaphroditum TaxID=289476 RepID=A0AA39H2V5_9BILA|nr:hypothetical protein QR680_002480 [Steinernema hermaphroditum]
MDPSTSALPTKLQRSRRPSRERRHLPSLPSANNQDVALQGGYDTLFPSQVASVIRCSPPVCSRNSFRSSSGYHIWPRPSLLTILCIILLTPAVWCSGMPVSFLNPDRNEGPFQKMVVDPKTERVYLNLKMSTITGPLPQPECDAPSCRSAPTYCKALTIYDDQLIECASSHDGKCRTRNLYNISKIEKESLSSVVANDRDSSTVIFVGGGPRLSNSSADSSNSVLYVASTAVVGRRVDVPAVTSLSLDNNNIFSTYFQAIGTGTRLQIERGVRDSYLIDYVGGFSSKDTDFVYFATRQPKDLHNPLVGSKLVRLCKKDRDYLSYVEMPLECKAGGVDYNLLVDIYVGKPGYDIARNLSIEYSSDVLFAVFNRGEGDSKNASSTDSALCVYTLDRINEEFRDTIVSCFRAVDGMQKNLPWFKSSGSCVYTEYSFEQVMCGKDVNQLIGGNKPITASPIITSTKSRFTSVVSSTIGANAVAFIGTAEGTVLKTVITSMEMGYVYDTLDVEEPVLQDLQLSANGDFLLILSPNKVSKYPVANCSNSFDCTSCLERRDPYCGWCVSDSQCSPLKSCERSVPFNNKEWLSYRDGHCPRITSVSPNRTQITSAKFIEIKVENFGDGTNLSCAFTFPSKLVLLTNASRVSEEQKVHCSTPQMANVPRLSGTERSLNTKLSLVRDRSSLSLASSNFTFYDCRKFATCSECVSSDFPCDWCIQSDQCVDRDTTENKCRGQHLVNSHASDGPSQRKGAGGCPQMISEEDIYVAAGKTKEVRVRAENLMPFMSTFKCQFEIDHSVHERSARREENEIVCDDMKFEYYGAGIGNGTNVANFSVVWTTDGNPTTHVLDNMASTRVIMYKCEQLASNCGLCLTLGSQFSCGWCESDRPSGTACMAREKCGIGRTWYEAPRLCPHPRIVNFSPKKGPIEGGTLITITGDNLGHTFNQVQESVTIANMRCEVIREAYVPSSQIVCQTQRYPTGKTHQGPIVVRLFESINYTAISNEYFQYVQPGITEFDPVLGPKMGGTHLTIRGQDLDAGSDVSVSIGDIDCKVINRTADTLVCRTGLSRYDHPERITVRFDNTKVSSDISYSYTENPIVRSVRPLSTILSGLITVQVSGDSFGLIQRARMVIMQDGFPVRGPYCHITSSESMVCKTPQLEVNPHSAVVPTVNRELRYDYGFEINDALLNASDGTKLKVYGNPILEKFTDKRFYDPDSILTISGQIDTSIISEQDVQIKIGSSYCNVTALTSKLLTCKPPKERPHYPIDGDPHVEVSIGGSTVDIGAFSYDTRDGVISPTVVMAIIIAIIFLVFLLFLLLVLYRRKNSSHKRQMKYLKSQMDQIEMKVATECKEAFAELQTNMNAFTENMQGTPVIPFLSYRDYASRVLFPNNASNAVLRELEVEQSRATSIEAGLRQFNRLLMNKTFLLTFIRTMEDNKYFVGKDRVSVGSLLMVVLQERMEYCTDILKQLLRELIARTVEKRFQPKILFRRSESVAERMLTAWFTFLMYPFLKESGGQQLYQLFFAIKQQMEKGPQDAITLDARYSLSEEKLLRSTFEFREIYIFLGCEPGVEAYPTHAGCPVRVLDCDSITQVKEKCLNALYKTTPYSNRPTANDVDLEWRDCPTGRAILQDLDTTSRSEPGGWRVMNTLAHYKVSDNSSFVLVPRQSNSYYNLSLLSGKSEKSTFSLKNNSPTLPRPFGTHSSSHSKEQDSCKLFHIVRPSEHGPGDQQDKMVTEIYLTRLLTMKGTLQQFIEELLGVIFSTSNRRTPLPACIKYMFDFMDDQAEEHGIYDPEVVHAWKSNALPLRFWVNLIKNPQFLFDIPKPTKIEGSLSVVAQTLMDACSTQEHVLTKDSPSSKLLFAKDIRRFKTWVDRYYQTIKDMPAISESDMNNHLAMESQAHTRQFHVFSALNELYRYLDTYKEQIYEQLAMNELAASQHLPEKLRKMLETMDPQVDYSTGMSNGTNDGYNSASRLMP